MLKFKNIVNGIFKEISYMSILVVILLFMTNVI